jgi:quercetin dioxygenase-like cupin family protein
MKNNNEITAIGPSSQKMTSLVEYAAGAVVSRTLIARTAGTVTLFSFDQSQGLSEHTAPFDALVQVLEGSASITLGGAAHELEAGDMIIMPAGVPHALKALSPMKMLLVMVRELPGAGS